MTKQKYEKPLAIDMPFEEALERLSGADPKEVKDLQARGPFEVVHYEDGGEDLRLDKDAETLWATPEQLGRLFDCTTRNAEIHIENIYEEGELTRDATSKEIFEVQQEGERQVKRRKPLYNLDVALSVGYRVSTQKATAFRKWATGILKAYLVEGYALNEARLRDDPKSLRDLAADVRALRSGEKQIYEAVRDCFKLSSTDYEPNSKHTKSFYAKLQDKFLVATTGKTASEIVIERAKAEKDHMGLTHMRGDFPDLWDAKVGKNYLLGDELYALHILCEQFLLFAESKALRGQKLTMEEMAAKFDTLLEVQGHTVFSEYKDYLAERAKDHAKRELEAYKKRMGILPKPREPKKLGKKS
jgi:hypothetical protein